MKTKKLTQKDKARIKTLMKRHGINRSEAILMYFRSGL